MLGLAESGYFQLSGLHRIQDPRAKPANPRDGGCHQAPECWRHTLLWWMLTVDIGGVALVLYVLYGVANGVQHEVLYGVRSAICPHRGSWNRRWISSGSTARWGSPLPRVKRQPALETRRPRLQANPKQPPGQEHLRDRLSASPRSSPLSEAKTSTSLRTDVAPAEKPKLTEEEGEFRDAVEVCWPCLLCSDFLFSKVTLLDDSSSLSPCPASLKKGKDDMSTPDSTQLPRITHSGVGMER